MEPFIDPKVDICFKALFANDQTTDLLLHFLNAVLDPPPEQRLTSVVVLDPARHPPRFEGKVIIVDVKAGDENGDIYQLEIQLAVTPDLHARMVYTHCALVAEQLEVGDQYKHLPRVRSIWILNGTLLPGATAYHHRFSWYDAKERRGLNVDHVIHTLELPRWSELSLETELDRWLWFLKHAEEVDPRGPLPENLETPEMRRAMEILKGFTESRAARLAYLQQRDAQRWHNTLVANAEEAQQARELAEQKAREAELKAEEAVLKAEEAVLKAEQRAREVELKAEQKMRAAEAELARLRLLLQERGE